VHNKNLKLSLFVFLLLICIPTKGAIDIIFDYSYDTNNYFTDEMKYVMDQAAFAFESRMANENFASMIPSDYDSSEVGVLMIDNPTTGGDLNVTIGSTTSAGNLVGSANEVIVFAGARSANGQFLGNSKYYWNYGDHDESADAWTTYMYGTRDNDSHYDATGGSLAINSDLNWYVDTNLTSHSDALNSGKYDFYSTVVHELGHIMGFNSWVDPVLWNMDWDDDDNPIWSGTNAKAEYSGNTVPFSADEDHFAPTIANGGDFNTSLVNCDCHPAMAEYNSTNLRVPFSELDFAVLEDIGYNISSTPISNTGGTFQDPTLGGSYYVPVKQSYSSWLAANASAAPEPHYIFPMLGGLIACIASRKKYKNFVNRLFN
jgi:hypothetical protein